jgi:hypothetical protein
VQIRHDAVGGDRDALLLDVGYESKSKQEREDAPANPNERNGDACQNL